METTGKMDVNNLNYLQRLTPKVYPSPTASNLPPTSGISRPGSSPHLAQQQQQQQNHRLHHPHPPQQQQDQSIYYTHQLQQQKQQSQQHPQQQLYHGASPLLTPSVVSNFQNSSIQHVHGHQGNLVVGHPQGQQPKVTNTNNKVPLPATGSVPVTNNQGPLSTGSGMASSGLTSSSDMELESMIVLFIEKRKELNQSLAKVEALSRQLEELKSGINGSTANYNRLINNPINRVIGDKFDDLEKLRQELANQTRLNDQQNVTLMHKQNLLMQRKCEIAGIDERISELQKRLAMKRMLNQQLSSQMKSRTGVAFGLPNDNSLNSGNPRLRSSVGPCNAVRLNNNYNRNNVTNTNVAAVEPFQRSTVVSNNYPAHSYDKSDENVDPMLGDLSLSKQHFQNLPFRNKFSPVEINSSNAYPATVNNVENTTNCILNSHQNHNHHQQQQKQQPFHLPLSHHHQHQLQQMQLQRQQQQQYVSVGKNHKNGNNMNMSLASEMIMNSHTESSERSCDENGTCELVRPQSDGEVGRGENTLINSPLKHKIHLRERPSPSGSSSSSSDQLPAGYSPSKKVLDNSDNVNNNHDNKSLNSVNHSSNNDYYGSRGGGGGDGDNNNETMMVMGNCDYFNNTNNNTNNYHCSEPMSRYDDTTTSNEQQLIDCIRKNSCLVNHHHHQQSQQPLQQKQQSEMIEKCVSDLPNNTNNNSNHNNGNNNQNCSPLDEDDRSSLSGPSITSSSGSNSSNLHHHPQNHHNFHHHHQQSSILFNDDDNGSQLKVNHNLRKSASSSAVSSTNRLTPNNCGPVYQQQSTNYTNSNNKDSVTDLHHHHVNTFIDNRSELMLTKPVPTDQQQQQQQYRLHQYNHNNNHHPQSNSFIRNGFSSNDNQESQISSSFYDYSPSSSSSNNIYSCSIDVSSRSLTNDANSSLSSSITTTISSASSSSVPQQQSHHQQHLSSSNLSSSPSSFKNGYHHPSSSSSTPLRESNSQKFQTNNKNNVDETTINSSSERLPPTVKEGNTGSINNSLQSMNQVNNKHHHQQQHLHNLHHRYQLQHRDDNNEEGNDFEEDADDINHVSTDDVDDNCKNIVKSRSSSSKSTTSSTINQNNKNCNNSGESSIYSRGDEMIANDLTNKETSTINDKRRPVIVDNKIEKELDVVGPTKSFERKPLNFQWPPPQYQSIDHHQQSKSITSKPDEGKKVTWAKKRILSKTTDDLRSPTKDSFCLKESQSLRPSSIHLRPNKQDDEDHQYYHQQSHKLSNDNKNNIINSFVNNNHCNKIKSSLKKDNHRANQKKDHEGLTRRVSFDPLALLLDAALEGELDLVKKTSKQIQDVSAANDEGITALHNTICAGHFEIVKYLVEIGCDVNAPDSDGWTPLHCAASCNNLTMVKYLVEHGACIFATTFPDKETAAQKCEEGEEGFDRCSQYLLHIQDSLGIMNDGIVYAVYDYEAQKPDELSFKDGDGISILRRGDEDEKDWWWARLNDKEGYVPRNLLGLYPRVKANKQDKVDAMD